MFISVVLPAPFSPSNPWISPRPTSRSIPSFAVTPGKRFVIPCIVRYGVNGSPFRLPGATDRCRGPS